jgi:small subunit ribosomal protein S16
MATRIRLRRLGANKRPFYRVVVADQRSPRDGRFIENIGKYHPLEDPSLIEIDEERALHWLRVGAQPSDQVRNLMVKVGIWDRFVRERPGAAKLVKAARDGAAEKPKLSKKAQAKAAAEAEAAAAPAAPEAAAAPAPATEEPVEAPADAQPTDGSPDEAPAPEAPAAEVETAQGASAEDAPTDAPAAEDAPAEAAGEAEPEA